MNITYPAQIDTWEKKQAWCYKGLSKLIKLTNWVRKWHTEGITENVYNQFPARVRDIYPYVPQLTEALWKDYNKKVFDNVFEALNTQIGLAKLDAYNNRPDLDPDFDEDID